MLDLLIPKLDGISLCRQLRAQGVQTPILLLTAKDQSADVVKGLDAGADDYLTKHYELCELLARMRALLRRGQTELVPAVLRWENLCVNPVSAEVTYKGQLISLTPKEYSLLGLFLRNPQRVFSRSEIIDRLWSIDAIPSEGTVTNLIKDLRQKLKAQGMFADLLETVYGLGYRLKTPPKSGGAKGVLSVEQGEQTHRLGEAGKGKRQMGLASVNKVIERYKDTFAQRVILLEQVELALRFGKLQPELRQCASNEAHKLAGTLGSFGYETGSKLAQAIEHLLMGDKPLAPKEASQLSKLVTELKEALSKPPTPLTIEELEPTQIPLVLVIDDESLTNQLKTEATNWGVRIEVAPNWAIASGTALSCIAQKQISQSPNAVLLNFNKQDPLEGGLTLLQKLKEQLPTTPILVIGEQDNLTERVAVSRLGAHRFLHKPVATAEVFDGGSESRVSASQFELTSK